MNKILSILLLLMALPVMSDEDEVPRSGFLPDEIYDRLEKIEIDKDKTARRWIGPELNFANFQKVLVDEAILYPEPEPGPQVSAETLKAISEYTTKVLRDKIGNVLELAWEPGPGVLRMRTAITGVSVQTEGVKAYEVLPFTAVFGLAKAVTGTRNRDVFVFFEGRFEDSLSGELVGAVQRAIQGKDLEGKKDNLTLGDMKNSLDSATEEGSEVLGETFSQK